MRLESLVLKQWRSFEKLELEFPTGVIGVRGANGAGKTTIAEAIGWALFGKLRPGQKVGDLRRQGAPDRAPASAELVFRLGDTRYTVERTAGGAAKLFIGDSLETEQVRATNARIIQELDMTWEVFQRTVFARQKDVAALDPTATAEARKRHVERLLGLERFRAAAERARSRARELEAELRGLREQAPDIDAARSELAQAKAEAAADDPAVQAAEQRRAEIRAEIETLEAALEAERARAAQLANLTGELARLGREIPEAEGDLNSRRTRLEQRAAKVARLTVLGSAGQDVDALGEARARWDELARCRADLETALTELESSQFDAAGASARGDELHALRAEQDALTDTPEPDVRALAARVAALEAARGAARAVDARAALERIAGERDGARGRLVAVGERIATDEAHLAEIERGGEATECPVCLRAYGEDIERIVARHRERLARGRDEAGELSVACDRLETEHGVAAATLRSAEAAEHAMAATSGPDDIDAARELFERARAEHEARAARRAQLRAAIPSLAQQVEADAAAKSRYAAAHAVVTDHRRRVTAAAAALAVDAYSAAHHDAAVEAHKAAAAAAQERAQLTAAIEAGENLPDEVSRLEERLSRARVRAREIEDALTALGLDEGHLPELRGRLSAARTADEAAATVVMEARIRAVERDVQVGELTTRLQEAEQAFELIRERERDVREHQVAGTLLSDYRSHQNLRAWPRLEEGASALLSDATDGRYADVRLSEDYRLMVYDRGEAYGLDRFSGGEQDLANLCLRLAIADWVARERNVEIGFVILDEVFGSQDEERRRRLMTELRSLGNRFHQLLVITHVADIADLCEHQLEVTLAEPGRSTAAFV